MTMTNPASPSQLLDGQALVRLLMAARDEHAAITSPAALAQVIHPEDGYELQRLHTQAVLARFGGKVIGAKLAGGDLASMNALGLKGQFRGPIFSAFTRDTPARLRRKDYFIAMVEVEVGFLIGEDIGGDPYPPARDELIRAIAAAIPCIEIADSRFANFAQCPPAAVLADLAFAGAWVRGTEVLDWRATDLRALQVRLLSSGTEVRSGIGARAMGDPLDALSAMVEDLGRSGEKLKAGQVVSTGTYTPPYPVKAGEMLVADFGSLGQVAVAFE